jgi:hypothetical protein
MLFGKRGRRSSSARQRKNEAFAPSAEALEQKILMAQVLLGGGTPKNIAGITTIPPNGPQTQGVVMPFIADSIGIPPNQLNTGTQTTDPGLGILETGANQNQGVGWNVAALGDMNGDGSNDYLVGAPTVTTTGTTINPSTGTNSRAFLVFGNRSVTVPVTQSWASATPEQRVGDITTLGNGTQSDPFTNRGQPYNYNFDGVTFFTSQAPNSQLGAWVASAGPNAFFIGAPGYPGGGRLYYITATGGFSSLTNKLVDLDSPARFPTLNIVTLVENSNSNAGLGVGSSFAVIPNLFGDGTTAVAIGEPTATVPIPNTASRAGNGGVYILPLSILPTTPGVVNPPINVSTSAQLIFAGATAGEEAGFSVANAGDVNGAGGTSAPVNDILIGAPSQNNNTGAAYLVYGGSSLTASPVTGVVDLNRINTGTPASLTAGQTPPPQGAVFIGSGSGDRAGFTVASTDFNGDGFSDILIGSPGFSGSSGRVSLIYGFGPQVVSAQTTAIGTVNYFNGPSPSAFLNGFNPYSLNSIPPSVPSWSFTGQGGDRAGFSISSMPTTQSLNAFLIGAPGWNGGQGSVYQVGRTSGTRSNAAVSLSSVTARQFTLTTPQNAAVVNFGNSVSAFSTGGGDFIAGAPGYTGTLPTQITTPPIPLVGAAAVVIQSLQVSPIPNLTGTTPPSGGGGGAVGSGAVAGAILPGLFTPTTFIPPFGSSFVPTVTNLSALNYAPIPLSVALKQYLPPQGFSQRQFLYNNPGAHLSTYAPNGNQNRSRNNNSGSGIWTLGRKVFTRGRFHPGKSLQWTHSQEINGTRVKRYVPVQSHIQRFTDAGSTLV